MRLALPNAAFIGFTGTPLFKQDEITKRIFGGYVSRYDFKRSEEDGATVKLVYENRGEKLGIARLDLNDRIAAKVEEAELDPDQAALLDKLLGKDYEVITADERLDKIAADFVEHARRGGNPASRCWSASTRSLRPDAPADQAAVEGKGGGSRRTHLTPKGERHAGEDETIRALLTDQAAKLENRPNGSMKPSSRSSSVKRRTRSAISRSGISTSSPTES